MVLKTKPSVQRDKQLQIEHKTQNGQKFHGVGLK